VAEPIPFARAADGVSIAYSTSGAGPVLVHARAWITHLELMWAEPSFRRFIEGLGDICTVVRYDGRGNGLSDRTVELPVLDDLVRDLAAVVDAVTPEPVSLWGSSFGGPVAIAYAAHRPERVERLILEGSFATLREQLTPAERVTMIEVGRLLQSAPEVAASAISYLTDPTPSSRHERRVARLVASVEPEMLRHLYTLAGRIDVRPLLPEIRAPTLVIHRRGSRVFPFHCARSLAAAIPRARLVPLDGSEHNPWEGDSSTALAAMRTFLGGESTPTPATVTLLFSDMVSSTELLQRLGDAVAAEVFREHTALLARAVAAHRGTLIKQMGDGILATFPSASSAVRCAVAVRGEIVARNTSASTPLHLRIGLAAGEPMPDGDDLFGSVVHLAARVCTAARPDEVLVTDAVRHLVDAKGFTFGASRSVRLKGFSQPVRVRPVLDTRT
jgi:class 3 adenylate cyclase